MGQQLIVLGHRLCLRGDWISRLVAPIFFYFFCPYPIHKGGYSARACNETGCCGCSNGRRFRE